MTNHPTSIGHRLASWIDRLDSKIASMIKWLSLFMVLVTMLIVLLRYVFNVGAIALQESVMYMHGILLLLGIPYGVLRDSHVRVDILYSRSSVQQQRWIDGLGHALFLLPVAAFIFWTSLPYVQASWRVLEGSAEVGGLPAIFLLKSLLPVMAALLFLQGLSQLLKTCLPGHSPDPVSDTH